ncbi:uncharacterized protein DEA37_0001260, partial [Paragonimus westermani]
FTPKKGIPVYTANRLQRWVTLLIGCDFELQFVQTTKFGHADILSRLIVDGTENNREQEAVIVLELILMLNI